jgi:hypothetical protein
MIAIDLADLTGYAAKMECDQCIVDGDWIEPAEHMRVIGPHWNATASSLPACNVGIEPLGNGGTNGSGTACLMDVDLAGAGFEPVKLGTGEKDVGCEVVDVAERSVQHCGNHRLRNTRCAILQTDRTATRDLERGPPTPRREFETTVAQPIGMLVQVDGDVE